jgi:ADP-L-glycero-D-manno-heptose 6-epimerase
MRILLTGYKGFIGSHMLKAIDDDHEVTTYEWGEPRPVLEGLDWVIHMGAISSTAETNFDKILTQNFDSTLWLLRECKIHNVKMQFASTAGLYGVGKSFAENAPIDPRTPYALSKYMCERYIKRYLTDNVAQIFRYFNVYGPEGEEHKGSQASPHCQFKKQFEETGQVNVFKGSDKYRRDFVPVAQVVGTHLNFLKIPESGTWNVGTGESTSFLDVAKLYTDNIVEIPFPKNLSASYQPYTCADMTKTRRTLDEYSWLF